ncbi:copper resistance protein NlpE [Photobacterium nomapromontoriensis]|uniref:copper resistance protein NlpE n=1 Tax=Photobacterium nomapromontoriensis TaxID=2910237 RepID=UPI003D0BD182
MKKTVLALILAGFALAGCDQQSTPSAASAQNEATTTVVEESTNAAVAVTTPVNQEGIDENDLATIDTAHNARNALDWYGTYTGILPCADCEGIKTELVVNKDGTYTLTEMYLGKENATFEHEGAFNWNAEGNTIAIPGVSDNAIQYFVGENQLFRLDREGNRITGDLATHYTLKKQ